MSKRFWLLGLMGLVLVALLVACGNNYKPSDGLLVVASQGSGLLETFGIDLNSGAVSPIAFDPFDTSNETCVLNGEPGAVVINPNSPTAYAIIVQNPSCQGSATGLMAFTLESGGNITPGNLISLNPGPGGVPVVPSTLSIDAAGKFLFVADRATTDSSGIPVLPGAVSVFAIGSGGGLTEVSGSPFLMPSGIVPLNADITNVAATPTVFPNVGINGTQPATCQAQPTSQPTTQFLYAVDTANYGVWEFQVDSTTGALVNPPFAATALFFPADKVPVGVAVDPCNRFVYVSDSLTIKVSAYQICNFVVANGQPGQCQRADGSLIPVTGSPFTIQGSVQNPGPIVVDPYGNHVYVVGLSSNTVSGFTISPKSGSLAAITPATVATGIGPVSIAIRQDNSWLFVANNGNGTLGGSTVSQYSIAPGTGTLTVMPAIQTDNYPFGVAVK